MSETHTPAPIQHIAASVMRNGFGEIVDDLDEHHIAVTRYGRPKAYVLSPKEYERLTGHVDTREAHATSELPPEHVAAIKAANADLLD